MSGRLEGVGITKRFGGLTAVDDVTVATESGTVAALIGPNGAGKTTLFQCLAGSERPDAGRVLLNGRDITRATSDARARLGLGRTFQRLAVFPTMSVADNLSVGAENRTTASAPARVGALLAAVFGFTFGDEKRHQRRVDEVVSLLGLGAVKAELAGSLPTGTLRLVELGRALCHDPQVLLLDEPASGLDTAETVHLQRVLRDVAAEGVAILLVEHDVDLVFGVADHVYAMAEGRLIADGPPDAIRRHPAVMDAYLS
jgi:branched-chain amino acid transport system ATP-binding protein